MKRLIFGAVVSAASLYGGVVGVKQGADYSASLYDSARAAVVKLVTIEKRIQVEAPVPDLWATYEEAAEEYKVPVSLVRAIGWVESRHDKENAMISNKGALGVMQVMPRIHALKTCPDVSGPGDLVGRQNIKKNVECGVRVLRACLNAATGDGLTRVKKALFCYNHDLAYVQNVLAAMLREDLNQKLG